MTRTLPRTTRKRRQQAKRRHRVYEPHWFTAASEVTIKRPDGSVEQQPPLDPQQLQKLVRNRQPITQAMRTRVLKRDKGICRYCGRSEGPFDIDHVIPVCQGGTSRMANLVTACQGCNSKKGQQLWKPKPLKPGLIRI